MNYERFDPFNKGYVGSRNDAARIKLFGLFGFSRIDNDKLQIGLYIELTR